METKGVDRGRGGQKDRQTGTQAGVDEGGGDSGAISFPPRPLGAQQQQVESSTARPSTRSNSRIVVGMRRRSEYGSLQI